MFTLPFCVNRCWLLCARVKLLAASLLLASLFQPPAYPRQASASSAAAQASNDVTEAVRALTERVLQLEAEVKQLKAEKGLTAAASSGPSAAPTVAEASTPAPAAPAPEPTDHMGMPSGDSGSPLLRIHGFADLGWRTTDKHGATNSFSLGQFNLFITSRLSEKFSVLSETVVEADPATNLFGIDLERLLIQFQANDYFHLSAGRFHTSIGFYNTAYHHSAWLQTTTGRPFLFDFEDHGGILPVHSVGVSATGIIPSGSLGLHYVAEMGNGRGTRTSLGNNPVQNVTDENNGKSVNVALYARPHAIPGLQAGLSAYHENLTPLGIPTVGEWIFSGHAVYQKPAFEFLNEIVLMRHTPALGGPAINSTGFYSQISRKWNNYRPYFRYEYVNVPDRDPIFPDIHLVAGPSFGLRYDWSDFVAFKIQYDRRQHRLLPVTNGLALQLSFAF